MVQTNFLSSVAESWRARGAFMQPVTRYAKSGDIQVAYQLFGEGPVNLVIAPFFVSNVEVFWENPDAARWLLRLASFARVAMFDKRGTGMSDRVTELPGLEQRSQTCCGRSARP
jgi:hypothetical protein